MQMAMHKHEAFGIGRCGTEGSSRYIQLLFDHLSKEEWLRRKEKRQQCFKPVASGVLLDYYGVCSA
jgi:hypothetical protein